MVFEDMSNIENYSYIYLLLYTRLYVIYIYMCVIDYNACLSSPCLNDGKCNRADNSFTCKCIGNFQGWTCSRKYHVIFVNVYYTS